MSESVAERQVQLDVCANTLRSRDPGIARHERHLEWPRTDMIGSDSVRGMCRNIRTLHNFEPRATEEEIHAAALQYVRKVSGQAKPSKANEAAFARAVDEIAHATQHLLADLVTTAPPRDREVVAARARARAEKRFGTAAA